MPRHLLYLCTVLSLQSCLMGVSGAHEAVTGRYIDLAGQWRFQLDPEDMGRRQRWFGSDLADHMALPGTTDLAGKGYRLGAETMDYEVKIGRAHV